MKVLKLAQLLVRYLNESETYFDFLEWAEDKGNDRDQIEENIENLTKD